MKYIDEYRDPEQAKKILRAIETLCKDLHNTERRVLQIMEVCGGHTHAIFRYGLNQLLPDSLEFVHGPGCPVCVLPRSVVDSCIEIARDEKVILATFGDTMRVPGSSQSLLEAKAQGCDIRMVYSPLDALAIARKHPDRQVVFFGIGFETTMPSTALSVLQAEKLGITNFLLFCNHITIIPTLKAVLDSPGVRIDGFLGPGHVSTIIGTEPYSFIASEYNKPLVITGFEPLDILQALWMVLRQLQRGTATIENQYNRAVQSGGQAQALKAIEQVFVPREEYQWRGLGTIDNSGVRLSDDYARFDAEKVFALTNNTINDPEACQCDEVIRGKIKPWQCKIFGTECTPQTPLGALMVSSEGACSAHYSYSNIITSE